MVDQEVNKKTIDNYKSDYEYFTGKASQICRNFALGGIAVIWIFKTSSNNVYQIPDFLIYPLLFFVLSLFSDLLQYVIGGFIWFCFYKYLEKEIDSKKRKAGDDVKAPSILPGIIHFFYWAKLILNIVGFILLGAFIFEQLSQN